MTPSVPKKVLLRKPDVKVEAVGRVVQKPRAHVAQIAACDRRAAPRKSVAVHGARVPIPTHTSCRPPERARPVFKLKTRERLVNEALSDEFALRADAIHERKIVRWPLICSSPRAPRMSLGRVPFFG